MDYFAFDLQLFADLKVVDLSKLTYDASRTYIILTKDGEGKITATLSNSNAVAGGQFCLGTVGADGSINLVTNAGTDEKNIAVRNFCVGNAAAFNEGNRVSFKVAEGVKVNGAISTFFIEAGDGNSLKRVCVGTGTEAANAYEPTSVTIAATGALTVGKSSETGKEPAWVQVAAGNVTVDAAAAPSIFMNDMYNGSEALKTLYGNIKQCLGDASVTYVNSGSSVATIAYKTQAKKDDVGANGHKYEISAGGSVTFVSNADKDNVTKNTLGITLNTAASTITGVKEKDIVTLQDGHVFTLVTAASGSDITVGTTISGLKADDVFTLADSSEDAVVTTYKVAKANDKYSLQVGGDQVGVYATYKTGADVAATEITDISKVTVTPVSGKDTVTYVDGKNSYAVLVNDVTLTLAANSSSLAAADIATPKVVYYSIDANGTIGGASASKEADKAAYFKVTYDPGYGSTANVKVELVSAGTGEAEKAVLALGKITVDALAVTGVTYGTDSVAQLKTITVEGGIAETVDVTNIAKGVEVTRGTGTTGTDDYAPWYTLDSTAKTIALSGLTGSAEGTYYFFEINAATKTDDGEVKYSIARDTTAGRVYSYDNGVKYSDNGGAATAITKSGFLVKIDTDAGTGSTPTYTVQFYAGSAGQPANLKENCWADKIVVNATGALANTASITITPDATSGAADKYSVESVANGILVKEGEKATGTFDDVTITRATASNKYTLKVVDGGGSPITNGIPLTSAATYVVTRDYEAEGTGHPTVTIKTGTPKASDSYITVTVDGDNVKVVYTNTAEIPLSGLTNGESTPTPVKVPLDLSGLTAGKTLDLTDTGATVDYSGTGLARGVTVKGAGTGDSIAYADGDKYNNAVTITLAADVDKDTTTYYKVKVAETADASTGLKKVELGAAYTAAELTEGAEPNKTPATTENYFTVVQTAAGAYTVSYHKAGSGTMYDLKGDVVTGQVTIDATNVADASATIAITNNNSVNKYAVTNVMHGGIASIQEDSSPSANVSYKEPFEYALSQAADIALDGSAGKYAVTVGTDKGITTYSIAMKGDPVANTSYLDVAVNSETGKITVSFKEVGTGVKLADFAANIKGLDAIKVAANDNLAETWTTLELADSKDNALKFAVTNLPSTVTTVTHGDATGDTIAYKTTYQFAEGKNALALGSAEGIAYYEVTATGGDTKALGIYTCSIGNALTASGETEVEKDASVATRNYFKVKTEANGNVTVTYHAAEQLKTGSVTSLALTPKAVGVDAITINVDPTKGPSSGTFKFGEAGGPELTYNITGLTAGQNVADPVGDDHVIKKYVTSYVAKYEPSGGTTDNGAIILADGSDKYYKVTFEGGTAEKNGVYTVLVKEATNAVTTDGSSYIMVKYTSAYQVSITYVNPNGEAYSLTKKGVPQIIVDADGLSTSTSKIDTIDITEATGGDYNGVNYALINVPAAVKANEGGIIGKGTGDTVSYKELAVLAADQTIKLTSDDVAYYTLKAATVLGSTTYSLEAAKVGAKNKPADTVNYFSVTKTSGGYTVAYHMAEGDGYSFSAATITVDASDVTVAADTSVSGTSAPGSLTITVDSTMGNVAAAVTNAKDGGIDISRRTGTTNDSISYSTTFAWAPGTYFIPVESASAEATVKAGAASGATEVKDTGGTQLYVVVKVKTVTSKDEKGATITKYVAEYEANTVKTTANTGVMTDGGTYTDNKLTIELPSTATPTIKYFDAGSKKYKAITGVKNGDVLTNVDTSTNVITGALADGNSFTVGENVFTSGAASNTITVTGASAITTGALKLKEQGATLAGSTATSTVKLVALGDTNKDGVVVTFKTGTVSSITGLQSGESIDVNDGLRTYHYEYDGNYLHRVLVGAGQTEDFSGYAAATTGDILAITEWSETMGQTVGQALNMTSASQSAYIAIGKNATDPVTVKDQTANPTTATSGTYYVKATTDTSSVLSLSVFKANANSMMEAATDYKGIITVDVTGKSTFQYVGNATTDATGASVDGNTYTVAFTNVTTGAVFSKLDSGDTITSGTLSDTNTIKIDKLTYTIAGSGTLKFTGGALTDGVITVKGDGNTNNGAIKVATLPKGVTVSYDDKDAASAGTATVTVAEGKITSIKYLGEGETIIINDGTYETAYTSGTESGGNTVITKKVTTIATSETVSYTATVAKDAEVFDEKTVTYTASGKDYINTFAWTAGSEGYFALTGSSSLTTTIAPASVGGDKVPMVENNTYVKATVTQKLGGKATDLVLTLTPYTVKNGEFATTSLYNAVVGVTAPASGTLTYAASGQTYNVAFTDVTKGSNLTLKKGDTVTTASLSDGDTINLNGQTITSKAGTNTLALYSDGSGYGVESGTVLVDGTTTQTQSGVVKNTVTYTAGNADTSKDGVIVKFKNDGTLEKINGVGIGESVKVVAADGTTTVYEAITATVVAKTVTSGGTSTTEVATYSGEILDNISYEPTSDTKQAFSTKITSAAQTGYFLVDSTAKTATIQDVDENTVIATYKDAGKTVVKAVLATDGTLTLTKESVEKTGAISTGGGAFTANDVATLTLNVTGGQAIKYTKQTGITNVAITGAGNGSVFTSFADGDVVTTASLSAASNEKVTFGSTDYVAGADGTMTFHGANAYTGTFKVTGTALSTTVTDDTTKTTTATVITYTTPGTSPAETDGVVVAIANGVAGNVTDLRLGEKVTIAETYTYKDGSTSVVTTSYEGKETVPSGSQKGMLTVERVVDIDGAKTVYKQVFKADGTAVVSTETGWETTGKTTTTFFKFGDTSNTAYTATGYFAATAAPTKPTDPGYKEENVGKYTATIAAQATAVTLGDDPSDAGYYLKVSATKDVTGAITFSEMKLMKLETSGTWTEVTDKELYSVPVTAPSIATITLADHTFPVVYNAAGTGSKVANVGVDDTVNFDVSNANDTVIVNSVTYTSQDNTTDMVIVGAVSGVAKTSAVTKGNLVVKAQAATASASGDVVSYDRGTVAENAADGAIVEITAGKITAIKDLDKGEKITVTSTDGTVTVYEASDGTTASKYKFTKTITKDGLTSTWTIDEVDVANPATHDIVAQNYGVSPKFAFPTEAGASAQGFFKVTSGTPSTATITENTTGTPIITMTGSDHVVRAVVQKDKTGTGYTVTALQVLEGQSLKDVSSAEAATVPATLGYTVNFTAPTGAGVTVGDIWTAGTPQTKTNVVYRDFQIAIANASAGQSYTGLDDTDTVTTAQLAAGDIVTVNTTKFAADANGALTMKGDGTATSGSFKVSKAYTVVGATDGKKVTMTAGEAMVVVVGGAVQSIYKLGSDETVTVTNTSTGAVDTYVAKTSGTQLLITKTSVADGITTVATATVADGEDILAGDYVVGDNNNKIVSQFDWTKDGGTGYFLVTATGAAGTAEIGPQKPAVTITKNDAGKAYVQVKLSADGVVQAIALKTILANGELADYSGDITSVTANVTAPTAKALTLNLLAGSAMPTDTAAIVNITGAIKDSDVVLGVNDTLTTAALADGDTVKVNGSTFTAGASTTLKFVAAGTGTATSPILSGGTVKFAGVTSTTPVSFVAAGADNKAGTAGTTDADNVTVTYTQTTGTNTEAPVVTVTNGVVTAISGFTNNGNTISTTANSVMVTYTAAVTLDPTDTTKVISSTVNAAVSGTLTDKTFTLAALDKGATIGGVVSLVSGADKNSVTVVMEGSTPTIKDGVLELGSGHASFTATGSSAEAYDDVVVAQTGTNGASIVTVKNGQVVSLTGTASGDTVTTTAYASDGATTPTYTCTITSYAVANGTVTKMVKTGTGNSTAAAQSAAAGVADADATVTKAIVSSGSDLMTANYFSETEDSTQTLVGQLSWNSEIAGRATGYFKMASKTVDKKPVFTTTTVAEQPTEMAVAAAANTTVRYLVANVENGTLTMSGLDVTNTTTGSGANKVSKTTMATVAASDASFAAAPSKITITAPTDTAITYDKGTGASAAVFGLAINKLAKNSAILNLDSGDKVTTNTLAIDESVTMNTTQYTAGAKGTLVFLGEGDNTPTATGEQTHKTALLTGTIKLVGGTEYRLAGAAENDATEKDAAKNTGNDITVTYTGTETDILAKVANGKLTSLTGLSAVGDKITVTNTSGKLKNGSDSIELAAGNVIVYEVIADQMIRRTLYNTDTDSSGGITIADTQTAVGYVTLAKAGAEIYSATYKAAEGTPISNISFKDDAASATIGYISLGTADGDPTTTVIDLSTNKAIGAVTSGKASGEGDLIITPSVAGGTTFAATPGAYYLRVKASTTKASATKAGTTTIQSVDVMKASATGALATVKATEAVYTGTLTIDGTKEVTTGGTTYAVMNYTLPKSRTWKLAVTDAGLGSAFTNLADGDEVSTVQLTGTMGTLAKGSTTTLYHADTTNHITETRKVVVSGGDGVVITTDANGAIATLTGLSAKSEKVTITETTATGLVVTEYAVNAAGNAITKTETDANGVKTVYTLSTVDGNDVIGASWGSATATTVNWAFDWSTDKNLTGYFTASNGKATVATGKGAISRTGTDYIALTIDADGSVSAIDALTYSTAGMVAPSSKFSGTINVKAPTAYRLQLNKSALSTNIDAANTNLAITGAISGSTIAGLTNGDRLTTASLAAANAAKNIAAGTVTVNDATYTAGAAGALGFLVQTVGNYGEKATLVSGTAKISSTTDGEGKSYLSVGTNVITATNGAVTVLARNNGKAFTIGDLDEGEQFTVEDTAAGVTYTYYKSGTTLLRKYNDTQGDPVTEVYAISSAKTITSEVMGGKAWNVVTATLDKTDATTGEISSSHYKAITTDLATLDRRIATDTRAGVTATAQTYDFVIDTYMYFRNNSVQANLAAQVINNKNLLTDLQTVLGKATYAASKWTYTAVDKDDTVSMVGRTIKVAKDWNVVGSDAADIITGASSGTNTITAGAGNDSITAGGANETFVFNLATSGRDTLKGYAASKDEISVTGDYTFQLDTKSGGNVFLFVDDNSNGKYEEDEQGVALMAVQGKAVKIDGNTFYFGNGALSGRNTKTTAGATFTYAAGAYYLGNDSGKNTLRVTTDKTKASRTTLGDTVTVDLGAKDATSHSYYTNINTIDASASANKMILTASSTGSTLKGGSYQTSLVGGAGNDVLQGGSGADVFWYKDGLDGNDTIKSYVAKNDAIYLGDWDGTSTAANLANGFTVKAEGTAVVLSNGSGLGKVTIEGAAGSTKALNISKDGTSTNTLSYYVAATAPRANTFTAKVGTDVTVTTTGTSAENYDTTVSMKSYYVGNDSATDTLKITGKSIGKAGDKGSAVFDLSSTNTNLSSIDVLDTTGVTGTRDAMSYIKLMGKADGTFTLTGSTNAYTRETFNLTAATDQSGTSSTVTVKNLSVNDVLEISAGATLDDKKNVATLNYKDGTTVTLNGISRANFYTAFGTNATALSTATKLTRTK